MRSTLLRPRTLGGHVLRGVLAWLLVAGGLRVWALPPMACDGVDPQRVRDAAAAAVDWFARNQHADGSFLYRYDARTGRDLGGYNLVRHAGVVMSLYQAAAAGFAPALAVADRGTAWALDRAVDTGDGLAFGVDGAWVKTGATALLAAGLAERREATGDRTYDDQLRAMGRFLAGQVAADGRFLAYWDVAAGAPVPERTSIYFTGEAWWALARLHRLFPQDGSDGPARAIGRYVIADRDAAERVFPPQGDHWSGYALAEIVRWPDGDLGALAGEATFRRWAQRQLGLFGAEVRLESQQREAGLANLARGGHQLTAGLATKGEGLWGFQRAATLSPHVPASPAAIAERATCVADLLVQRQVDAAQAADAVDAAAVRGAWLTAGVTQMDDQQHALSALLATARWLASEGDDRGGPT